MKKSILMSNETLFIFGKIILIINCIRLPLYVLNNFDFFFNSFYFYMFIILLIFSIHSIVMIFESRENIVKRIVYALLYQVVVFINMLFIYMLNAF